MATRLADVIVPEYFKKYVTERTTEKSLFVRSGAVVRDAAWDALLEQGGELFQMPFWKALTGSDQLVTSNGTLAVDKITTGKDASQRFLRGKAWGSEDIAGILAGDDPMDAIIELASDYWAERFQDTTLSLMKGVFLSPSMADLTNDIFAATGTPDDTNQLNGYTFIDAAGALGDAEAGIAAVAMHSDTERSLRKNDLIEIIRDSQGEEVLRSFQGKTVIIDDDMPVETINGFPVYTTYLFGNGAIAWGERTGGKPIDGGIGDWYQELSRDSLSGVSYMVNRRDFLLHPRGVRFTQATMAAETPTNAELESGTNWERVYQKKNVKMIQIRHNIL